MKATGTFFLLLAVVVLTAGYLPAGEDGSMTVDEIIIAYPESQLASITVKGKYTLPTGDPLSQMDFLYSSDGGKTYTAVPVPPSGIYATKYEVFFSLPSGNYQGYGRMIMKSGKEIKTTLQYWTVK